jgi:hypothetical protein
MYADVSLAYTRREEEQGPNAGACQVTPDLTCLVTVFMLRELTGNDRTLKG